jgi:hypothetical protein
MTPPATVRNGPAVSYNPGLCNDRGTSLGVHQATVRTENITPVSTILLSELKMSMIFRAD